MELYNQLSSKLDDTELTDADWKLIRDNINNMTLEHRNQVFALIIHHFVSSGDDKLQILNKILEHNDGRKLTQIYGIKMVTGNKGVIVSCKRIPKDLQRIILKYIKLTTTVK